MPQIHPARPCRRCGGSGVELDPVKFGERMRAKRIRAKLTMAQIARQMGCSEAYVGYLEHGLRSWSDELRRKYREALANP